MQTVVLLVYTLAYLPEPAVPVVFERSIKPTIEDFAKDWDPIDAKKSTSWLAYVEKY